MIRNKKIICLRKKSHISTRLELRDERTYYSRLIPWLALANISFTFVDVVSLPHEKPVKFFVIRVCAVLMSALCWELLRGRSKYGLRFFIAFAPYVYSVEYIMIRYDLIMSPYFSGVALVMLTATMLFPMRVEIATVIYGFCILPILFCLVGAHSGSMTEKIHLALMALGSALVCAINSGQVWKETKQRLWVSEALARDLGRRDKEVREKARELTKRQIFESQFSPQVVNAILKDQSLTRTTARREIVNVVIDIEESTSKANLIDPAKYQKTVEEVMDVFSAACLKWNVTLDKFTGDGVQAFAGAPFTESDDLDRAIMACRESINMLLARKSSLELDWGGELNVRFALCKGIALVGFVGRGIFKSYTAIGDMISFTHRLAAVGPPWVISAHVWGDRIRGNLEMRGFNSRLIQISNIKGFGDKKFDITVLTPHQEPTLSDAGRCPTCGTPLVMSEMAGGIPRIFCAGCESRRAAA